VAVSHIVKEGDTLASIARKYNLNDWTVIAKQNGMEPPYQLQIGQDLWFNFKPYAQSSERDVQPHLPAVPQEYNRHSEPRPAPATTPIERYERARQGGDFPPLGIQSIPPAALPYLDAMNEAVLKYVKKAKLSRHGKSQCGAGVCAAFLAAERSLTVDGERWKVPELDSQIIDRKSYQHRYGSGARDAYLICDTLRRLASCSESCWVEIDVRGLPMEKKRVKGHESEGEHWVPYDLPAGALLLYPPSVARDEWGDGSHGLHNGHIEFLTKNENGQPLFVADYASPTHGGSPPMRKQFDRHMDGSKDRFHCFALVPPHIKEEWLRAHLSNQNPTYAPAPTPSPDYTPAPSTDDEKYYSNILLSAAQRGAVRELSRTGESYIIEADGCAFSFPIVHINGEQRIRNAGCTAYPPGGNPLPLAVTFKEVSALLTGK
jgi:hypothetical protein